MKKFNVMIEETVSQVFEVEAGTLEEAKEAIRRGYLNGEYVLEPGDCEAARMMVLNDDLSMRSDDNWEEI